jgi:hypothetical protein
MDEPVCALSAEPSTACISAIAAREPVAFDRRSRMCCTAGKIFKTAPANTDNGEWLPKDAIPPTLEALLKIFFEEMWPVLQVRL